MKKLLGPLHSRKSTNFERWSSALASLLSLSIVTLTFLVVFLLKGFWSGTPRSVTEDAAAESQRSRMGQVQSWVLRHYACPIFVGWLIQGVLYSIVQSYIGSGRRRIRTKFINKQRARQKEAGFLHSCKLFLKNSVFLTLVFWGLSTALAIVMSQLVIGQIKIVGICTKPH